MLFKDHPIHVNGEELTCVSVRLNSVEARRYMPMILSSAWLQRDWTVHVCCIEELDLGKNVGFIRRTLALQKNVGKTPNKQLFAS
jgi:hypothetical protein